jgi:hypothetical protein
MSHHLKRLKPLGKDKKNMKKESAESQKQLPTALESVEVCDFLYVDRARISAYYAQLFPQGLLTNVKTVKQQSFSDENDVGTDVKVFKAESKSLESGLEGIEHMFDTSWSIPLEVLARLSSLSLVKHSLMGAGLGAIVLTDCHLRVIDFASMQNLWEPSMRMYLATGNSTEQITTEAVPKIAEALKAMPQAIHAQFLTKEGFLWSSLQPAGLNIPISDVTLKYGGTVSGSWKVLYILDAWADGGEAPDVAGWSGGHVIDSVLGAMHALRTMMGRPPSWFGITPLMIFRDSRGWTPNAS